MERISPTGNPDLGRSRKKKDKIEKKKSSPGMFLKALEKAGIEETGSIVGDESFIDDLPLEEMIDEIHQCGEKLKDSPTLALIREYKQAVRNFMHHVVQYGLKTETKEGARCNPLKKQKRFTIIKIVDEKLDRLAAGILQNQKSRLDLLHSIDEINGLLVDLVS